MKKTILIITLFAALNAFAEPNIESERVGSCQVTSSSKDFTQKGDTVFITVYKIDNNYYGPMLLLNFFDKAGNEISTKGLNIRTNINLISGKVQDSNNLLKIKNRYRWFKADFQYNKENKKASFQHQQSSTCEWGHCSSYVDAWDLSLENCEINTDFLKDVHFESNN